MTVGISNEGQMKVPIIAGEFPPLMGRILDLAALLTRELAVL